MLKTSVLIHSVLVCIMSAIPVYGVRCYVMEHFPRLKAFSQGMSLQCLQTLWMCVYIQMCWLIRCWKDKHVFIFTALAQNACEVCSAFWDTCCEVQTL